MNYKLFLLIMSLFSVLLGSAAAQGKNFKSVTPTEFEQVIADTAVVRLDVRTPEEWAEGHIEGTKNIDVLKENFAEKAQAALPKDKTIALYCRSGHRSKKAATILSGLGYTIVELDNGYLGWTGEGKPVVK